MFKSVILALASALCFVVVLPFLLLYWLRVFSFTTISQLFSLVPGAFGIVLRRVWYTCTLASCGRNFTVDFMAALRSPKARVGNNVYIGVGSWMGLVNIGDDVMFADHVVVLSGSRHHGIEASGVPMRLQEGELRTVKIGNDVWLGSGVRVMADVADHTVVGAGSVVKDTFEAHDIIAGVPAKKIRSRKDR